MIMNEIDYSTRELKSQSNDFARKMSPKCMPLILAVERAFSR